MEGTRKTMSRGKKIAAWVCTGLLLLILILGGTIYAVWHNEISTVASMKLLRERDDAHQDGAVYTMHVKGGFYLDDFVAQGGVKNDSLLSIKSPRA